MSRYVDVEPLDVVGTKGVSKDYADGMAYVLDLLDNLPTIDVEPVRHGHWEQDGHHIRCSKCRTYFCITDREGDSFPINYCPCCGAKMDEEEHKND